MLLVLFFVTVDLRLLLSALSDADYLYVAPAIGLYFVSLLFRTIRWQWLLRHLRPIDLVRLYPVVVIGYMANNLLPMRLGELVRSHYVGEREGVSKTSALVTIVIERLLDAITLLFFIFTIAIFVPLVAVAEAFGEQSSIPWPMLVVGASVPFVATFGSLLLVAFAPSKATAVAMAVINMMPSGSRIRIERLFYRFLHGLKPLSNPNTILAVFLLSIPVWLFEAGLFFLIGFSFDLHEVYDDLGQMAVAAVLITAIANIGSSIPAAPGGVGLFELVAREAMVLLPLAVVDRSVAGGYVTVVHASLLLSPIIVGQVFLWTQHLSLSTLSRAGQGVLKRDEM